MVIVVLSPPRAGSSCVAGILHNLGVSMGETFARDLGGYRMYEDQFFVDFGDWFSRRAEGDYNKVIGNEISLDSLSRARLDGYLARRNRLPVWGWKHPNTLWWIRYGWRHLDDPRWVWVYRSEERCADSLQRMGREWFGLSGTSIAEHRAVYGTYQALRKDFFGIVGPPHLTVDFEELLRWPSKWVSKIVVELGIEPTDSQVGKAISGVTPRR